MTMHRKSIGPIIRGIILLFFLFLTSCETYYLSNNKKYRNYFPIEDNHLVLPTELDKNRFDLARFLDPDSSETVQFIQKKDIDQIIESRGADVLLLFYYPDCGAAGKEVEIAKFAEENNIPYLLISNTYSPRRMKDLYLIHGLKNRNQYILPTTISTSKMILRKSKDFITELCPACYEKHKDDLIFANALIVSKENGVKVNPLEGEGTSSKDFLINWVKEELLTAPN